jgi:hypothetical protein
MQKTNSNTNQPLDKNLYTMIKHYMLLLGTDIR